MRFATCATRHLPQDIHIGQVPHLTSAYLGHPTLSYYPSFTGSRHVERVVVLHNWYRILPLPLPALTFTLFKGEADFSTCSSKRYSVR